MMVGMPGLPKNELPTISPTIARRLATAAQLLDSPDHFAKQTDKERIMTAVRQIRCLQIDPINVVARNPLLVLWSRIGAYEVDAFGELLWEDRLLFEYWAHAASLVLAEDFPIFRLWMEPRPSNGMWSERYHEWLEANEPFRQYIFNELKTRGPLFVEELEDRAVEQWPWGNWSNKEATRTVHRMIEAMWDRGQVTVTKRAGQGFGLRKQWGLLEAFLPEWTKGEPWSEEEVVRGSIARSLNALGVARPKHIKRHFTRDRYPDLAKVIKQMAGEGQVWRVRIAGDDPAWAGEWFASSHAMSLLESGRLEEEDWGRTVLLSPFDNLHCDRKRTEEMWGFYYRSEIYTPKAKRQYGYYTMPILHGERLVGRLDPAMDRKNNLLNVYSIHLEAGVEPTAELGAGISRALQSLATFLGADEVVLGPEARRSWPDLL
jgi:uncharacterized protein YcaQ